MENFIITVTYLLIGMALKRIPDFHKETGAVLNLFVIYISLPALVLLNIPELVFSENLLVPAVMPWVMLLLSSAAILSLSKLLSWDGPTTGCLLLLVPLGNTAFLGIPMVKAFFGEQAIPYALAISANLSPALTAALVGIGIIFSFATLPVLYQLL